MKKQPKIYLIILTFNARELALQCLQSVSRVTTPNLTVVVVDNASSDGTY
ncbi:MAG: glycosyltransferase family 2 protein, partial [Chloroflexota bacterium]